MPTTEELLSISIHAPTKGATIPMYFPVVLTIYFNPRSHEGSDSHRRTIRNCVDLFQSTLPRRERPGACTISVIFWEFQSTLPRRERPVVFHLFLSGSPISIHAPTKGATWTKRIRLTFFQFQSTLPRRERLVGFPIRTVYCEFQSTLPRRERQ